jgi:hypothetical protein
MEHIGLTVIGVAFWAFLAVSAVAGIVGEYRKRRIELEPLRAAIERGQQLDPALVERLMMRPQHGKDFGLEPINYRIGGIVTVASGIGLALLSFFINPVVPSAFYPLIGVGVVAVCVGVGLLICARVLERHRSSQATREAGA